MLWCCTMMSVTIRREKIESRRRSAALKLILLPICGVFMGYFVGSSFHTVLTLKVELPRHVQSAWNEKYSEKVNPLFFCEQLFVNSKRDPLFTSETKYANLGSKPKQSIKIYVPTNPHGAESLPPGIIESLSDLYLHGLRGNPRELVAKPKYLLVLTVGYLQKAMVDDIISKFSENFSFVLFHYDGRASEWEQFEWSQRAIHVSARRQTKWWYAKRFLHPDIIAPYEYIFIWDEDLGVENFNAEEYIKLAKKHGLEISQPGIESKHFLQWSMTRRRDDVEVHKETEEKPGWCHDPHLPPCAGFVEIMAPVFSRESWRCVWHMIQNDLVHGWGLDLALQRCVKPAHEKIGVVDAQWIEHKGVPSLGDQGKAIDGKAPWKGVRSRCFAEWKEFESRMRKAEREHLNLSMH
ncbi:uncharacterized protein LOC122669770 isoform X2 [Telopea speciosissima]|uniref:uncharacterized protein LOC122669770 isoform X2 n=1 Tax=Telopea speciosissima TaxID=54955 RepID=UPI001CC82839|nr:uncharacterized protein LOC122669770 isoform X2 [Telopea speciosissima]